jgi:hypothetical protein
LGEVVYQQTSHLFSSSSRTIIIDHPYHYNSFLKPPAYDYPLKMGQIGVGDHGKGTHLIFELAEKLQHYIQSGKLELLIIGPLNPKLHAYTNGFVTYFNEPLSSADFSEKISHLHYALFFRDSTQGVGVASGSFFDAVKYKKPFMSLQNPFIQHYAARFPGTGSICESLADMAEKIEYIIGNMDLSYHQYVISTKNMAQMQSALSIHSIAEQFRQQL